MLYHQITAAERYTLGLLRRRGLRPATIARILGRHRCTIGRELRHQWNCVWPSGLPVLESNPRVERAP